MKFVIIAALALVAIAAAAPQQQFVANILHSEFDRNPEGSYKYAFETEDGVKREENGVLKQVVDEENKPQDVLVVRGSYSYPDDEGKIHTINYFADESGYHAEGEDVPKPARR